MSQEESISYDESPYPRVAHFLSRPTRLQGIAFLHGLESAPPDKCRVLELGCATGGNLLPLACHFPESHFVGIDYSKHQIDLAQDGIRYLGLKNIEFKHLDISNFNEDIGLFDYIIAHGIFSWIPPELQNMLLQVCQRHLDPRGVAYISYNAQPGWHANTWIREAMRFGGFAKKGPDQLTQARLFLKFIVESPYLQPDFKKHLNYSINELNTKEDTYLLHEYLEDHNYQFYFIEFMEKIKNERLQYLGDANKNLIVLDDDSPVSRMLRPLITDSERQEQFLDFIHNRTFRQSLLCHQELRLDRSSMMNKLENMYAVTFLRRGADHRDPAGRSVVTFSGPGAPNGIPISDPLVSAGLLCLEESYPQPVHVKDLWKRTMTPQQAAGEAAFLSGLLQLWRMGLVELQRTPDRIPVAVSERPSVSAAARYLSRFGETLTCLNHTPIGIPDHFRKFLAFIDGSRTIEELAAKALEHQVLVVDAELDPAGRMRSAMASMHHFLGWCSRNALLEA